MVAVAKLRAHRRSRHLAHLDGQIYGDMTGFGYVGVAARADELLVRHAVLLFNDRLDRLHVDLFGRPPMGPAVFARKFNSPVVPAFILRQPNGKHKVVVGEVMRYEDTGDTDKDLFDFTARMTKVVEQIIRDNPTQWLWFQKRWNTKPEQQKTGKHHTVRGQDEQK